MSATTARPGRKRRDQLVQQRGSILIACRSSLAGTGSRMVVSIAQRWPKSTEIAATKRRSRPASRAGGDGAALGGRARPWRGRRGPGRTKAGSRRAGHGRVLRRFRLVSVVSRHSQSLSHSDAGALATRGETTGSTARVRSARPTAPVTAPGSPFRRSRCQILEWTGYSTATPSTGPCHKSGKKLWPSPFPNRPVIGTYRPHPTAGSASGAQAFSGSLKDTNDRRASVRLDRTLFWSVERSASVYRGVEQPGSSSGS